MDTNLGAIKVVTDADDRIGTRDVYNELWRCRDFEISHLWQRSIFLATFLVLCFTGYGVIVLKILMDEIHNILIGHIVAFGIGIVGILLSILWIMMAKGSKAWYEIYESAICAFGENSLYMTSEGKKIGCFNQVNLNGGSFFDIDTKIWTHCGGAFSPSKINILIGQIALVIWIILSGIHLSRLTIKYCFIEVNVIYTIGIGVICLFAIIGIVTLVYLLFKHITYSQTLMDNTKIEHRL